MLSQNLPKISAWTSKITRDLSIMNFLHITKEKFLHNEFSAYYKREISQHKLKKMSKLWNPEKDQIFPKISAFKGSMLHSKSKTKLQSSLVTRSRRSLNLLKHMSSKSSKEGVSGFLVEIRYKSSQRTLKSMHKWKRILINTMNYQKVQSVHKGSKDGLKTPRTLKI